MQPQSALIPISCQPLPYIHGGQQHWRELLPLVDRELIQVMVAELVEAGIERIVLVNNESRYRGDYQWSDAGPIAQQQQQDILRAIEVVLPSTCVVEWVEHQPGRLPEAILASESSLLGEGFLLALGHSVLTPHSLSPLQTMLQLTQHTDQHVVAIEHNAVQYVNPISTSRVRYSNGGTLYSFAESSAFSQVIMHQEPLGRYVFAPSIFTQLRQMSEQVRSIGDILACLDCNETLLLQQSCCSYCDCDEVAGYRDLLMSYLKADPEAVQMAFSDRIENSAARTW